ncbi:similar to Saccharomyces cerevisiae YAL037W Putative protein of unknown function [Maudiozyma saulgeensis]|uniref:Uncharacterized protein n=1 Tax=Maudiozyma saulgeensis TaxID=1789683 RepID=A0A1X7R4X7_9SACH|nr:similar to Saccharomyces cerevisiae YAL037W Putative protein of unknown function [Kazachstania saulgeensis]
MTGTAALYMNEPSTNFMENYDAYYTQNHDQPLVLDRHILFGTADSIINHPDTLTANNIRFFIGIDIPTNQMAQLYNSEIISGLYGSREDIVMVNFDSQFIEDFVVSDLETLNTNLQNDPLLVSYLWNNSQLLKMMSEQLAKNNDDTSKILHRYVNIYKRCNSFTVNHIEKFQTFNDLLTLFQMTNAEGKVLVFSDSTTNENMLTLLISTMLKRDTSMKVQQAYQFITSLMDTPADNVRVERIFLCSGLTNYVESVKKFNAINGRRQLITNNYNSATSPYAQANMTKRSMRYTDSSNIAASNTTTTTNNDYAAQTATGKRARSD